MAGHQRLHAHLRVRVEAEVVENFLPVQLQRLAANVEEHDFLAGLRRFVLAHVFVIWSAHR